MKNILVATDFSDNSKAALRFAIQLASQHETSLTFLHVQDVWRMTTWNDTAYKTYAKEEMAKSQTTLEQFVETEYKRLKINAGNYTCVIQNSPFVDSTIMAYAADHTVDFICISTRGAGSLEKLLGTTTANLINQSPVPIIAVPGTYRATALTSILYASDLSSLEYELKRVVDFARPLAASVELLHFSFPSEPVLDPEIINMAVQKFSDYAVYVQLKPLDLTQTMIANIELAVKKAKPSVMIMFTTQNQGFFHQLFSSGNSVDYSFLTNVPLLVFRKG